MLSYSDWLKELYLELLSQKWTLNDIDDMDFYRYLDLLSYDANKALKTQCNSLDDAGL